MVLFGFLVFGKENRQQWERKQIRKRLSKNVDAWDCQEYRDVAKGQVLILIEEIARQFEIAVKVETK